MKLSISLTNHSVSYELARTARDVANYLETFLWNELLGKKAFASSEILRLNISFGLYSGTRAGRVRPDHVFPDDYPRAVTTRHLFRLREFEADCNLDWSHWNPQLRQKAGLPNSPSRNEIFVHLDRCARVLVAQAALELGELNGAVAALIGPSPIVPYERIVKVAAGTRKRRLSGKLNRKPIIPLEVMFPHELDLSEVRDLLEETVVQLKLGFLDGWSYGSKHHEVGFVVKDAQTAVTLLQQRLTSAGYDASLFGFEALD